MVHSRPKIGFRKISAQPDWLLDGRLLVWNRPRRKSIEIASLIELEDYSNPFVPETRRH